VEARRPVQRTAVQEPAAALGRRALAVVPGRREPGAVPARAAEGDDAVAVREATRPGKEVPEERARPQPTAGMVAYVTRRPGCASSVLRPPTAEIRCAIPPVTSASIV
jgi:hypothetical protein